MYYCNGKFYNNKSKNIYEPPPIIDNHFNDFTDFTDSIVPPRNTINNDEIAAFYGNIVADIDINGNDKNTTNDTNDKYVTFNGIDIIIPNRITFDENPIEPIEPVVNTIRRDDDFAPAITDDGHFAGLIKIDNIFRKRSHGLKRNEK